MASSSSSFSSKAADELQADHPCYCNLPACVKISRTKDSYGRKFRVCPNSLNGRGQKCKFWEWVHDERNETKVDYSDHVDTKVDDDWMLKASKLEHEIRVCKMKVENEMNLFKLKMEQEILVVRQEVEKARWFSVFLFLFFTVVMF